MLGRIVVESGRCGGRVGGCVSATEFHMAHICGRPQVPTDPLKVSDPTAHKSTDQSESRAGSDRSTHSCVRAQSSLQAVTTSPPSP